MGGVEERGRRVSTTDPFNSLSIEAIAKLRIKLQRLSPLHFFPALPLHPHPPPPPSPAPFFFSWGGGGEERGGCGGGWGVGKGNRRRG